MKKIISVILVLCVLFLSACTSNSPADNAGTVTIAASFYPVYIFTMNLLEGIEVVNVQCMAEQNVGCLHDYTLTAKDAKLLSDAKLLVINGAGMESFLEDAFEGVEDLKVVDSSVGIKAICADEHSHSEDEHTHSHEENSHIWLSVENARLQVENIKKGLVAELPQFENQIEENYNQYIGRLDALVKERDSVKAKLKSFSAVSFHGGYEYLAEDFGFEIIKTIESDEGTEPSARVLAQLSDEIKSHSAVVLLVEPLYNGSAAGILSAETDAEIIILNPVISGEESLTAYEDAMKENYKTILKAVK